MFNAATQELPQKSVLEMKQDDKFFSRLLSKETSMSNPSFRVAAVAVPFVWESQPGTPKYTFSEGTLAPLTPPPSYHFTTSINDTCKKQDLKKHSSSNIFLALLQKLNPKKIILSSFSLSSSSSSSSSYSSKVTSVLARLRRRRFLSQGSSFDFRGDNEEDGAASPTSTLCFGIPRSTSAN